MMIDPLLTPVEVGEWIGETPETIIEWGEEGTDLFPFPIRQSDGTLRWKRSHVQQWLESLEDQKNVGLVQEPRTQETLHTPKHPQEFQGDEEDSIEA